jgi:predicted PurR-regulated permease PerM
MTAKTTEARQPPARSSWVGLLIALAVALMVVLRILAVFVGVIFVALVAAGLLARPFSRLTEIFGGRRRLAALSICVGLVVAVMVPLSITAVEVSQEALDFYAISTSQLTETSLLDAIEANRGALDRLNQLLVPLGAYLTPQDVVARIAVAAAGLGGFFYKQGVSLATGLVRFVIGFLVWVIALYYLMVDGPAVRSWFRDTIPLPPEEQDLIRNRFMGMASSLVVGNGVAAMIQGVAGGLVFAALDLPGPMLWGVVMGILAFIPVVGISLVYIPVWGVLLLAGQTGRAFALLVPLAVLATVVEYWLKPVLVGRRAHLHTLLVFFSLLGGFDAFGPVGLLIGPLMMTVFLTLVSIYRDHYRPYLVGRDDQVALAATDPRTVTNAAGDGSAPGDGTV